MKRHRRYLPGDVPSARSRPSNESRGGWRPAPAPLSSRFAADVDPLAPHPEHPRPQLVREGPEGDPGWRSLNGLWDFALTPLGREPERFPERILVPFPIESSLSGVGRALRPDQRLWLRRRFEVPRGWRERRVLVHFGAVDWEARVWLNGCELGMHRGGFSPFCFDLSPALRREAANELRVAVFDPSQRGGQARGKQSLRPRLVFYTAVSGIWQSVWLEALPQRAIRRLRILPQAGGESVLVTPEVEGGGDGLRVQLTALDPAFPISPAPARAVAGGVAATGETVELRPQAPRLWSREDPHLYGLRAELRDGDRLLDRVQGYFGLRWFDVGRDAAGCPRLQWNGEPVFQLGPLDQGYWPDGLYTAPTVAALRSDLEAVDRIGFNLVRKHVKVEPLRWYHHCDRMGLAVWQDMPNGRLGWGFGAAMFWHLFARRPIRDDRLRWRFGRQRAANRQSFWSELDEVVDGLRDVPCIAGWVPFNEGWGQFDSAEAVRRIRARDPSRPIDAASGWFDQGAGDLVSAHRYPGPGIPRADDGRARGCSEYGGLGLAVDGHRWHAKRGFAYRKMESREALAAEYLGRLDALRPLIERGLSQAVYTQLCDVEIEINGLLTYDRSVPKADFETLAQAHRDLLAFAREVAER